MCSDDDDFGYFHYPSNMMGSTSVSNDIFSQNIEYNEDNVNFIGSLESTEVKQNMNGTGFIPSSTQATVATEAIDECDPNDPFATIADTNNNSSYNKVMQTDLFYSMSHEPKSNTCNITR